MGRFLRHSLVFAVLLVFLQNVDSDQAAGDDVYEACQTEIEALQQCASRSAGFTARLTTLNTFGRFGPQSLGNFYKDQDHERLVTLDSGIQELTIPYTGDYVIEAAGAAGGYDGKLTNSIVEEGR
ncbi:uncharacterized protein [Ptychodera flava]|uniref:uncharacterized protein n=1 Tax=Ptychodera flava TaxID=63121 RepID=UPI003969F710